MRTHLDGIPSLVWDWSSHALSLPSLSPILVLVPLRHFEGISMCVVVLLTDGEVVSCGKKGRDLQNSRVSPRREPLN
jgi:hypothetical protein